MAEDGRRVHRVGCRVRKTGDRDYRPPPFIEVIVILTITGCAPGTRGLACFAFTTSCEGARTCVTATEICAAATVFAGGKLPIHGIKVMDLEADGLLDGAGTVVLVGVALIEDGGVKWTPLSRQYFYEFLVTVPRMSMAQSDRVLGSESRRRFPHSPVRSARGEPCSWRPP